MSQLLIDAAKAPFLAYGEKNWDAVRASLAPGFLYDEVATGRKFRGADETIAGWQGWAAAFPDSKATFHGALVSGDNVVLELTWRGTHTGPLETPAGRLAATGRSIEMRACAVVGMAGGKAQSMRQYFDMVTMMRQLGAGA
jgi:steroid delta-isomerase-like uncharacterized protein